MSEMLRLFPQPHTTMPLKGLYLTQGHHHAGTRGNPFVYANFITSLDGRIALQGKEQDEPFIPDALTNPNDFRLFLELQAQADCLITHGGYCRDLAAGKLGNVLQVGAQADAEDLTHWRKQQGLQPQPDIVIASSSLDFPMPEVIDPAVQKVMIVTGDKADKQRVDAWQQAGYPVFTAGPSRHVEGTALVRLLADAGYQSIYLVAGPQMLETMLHQQQLSCLYLTQSHQFLGGEYFRTPLSGQTSGPYGRLELQSLYLDTGGGTTGQWFSKFKVCYE